MSGQDLLDELLKMTPEQRKSDVAFINGGVDSDNLFFEDGDLVYVRKLRIIILTEED
jgi:hypothetical protein